MKINDFFKAIADYFNDENITKMVKCETSTSYTLGVGFVQEYDMSWYEESDTKFGRQFVNFKFSAKFVNDESLYIVGSIIPGLIYKNPIL